MSKVISKIKEEINDFKEIKITLFINKKVDLIRNSIEMFKLLKISQKLLRCVP